MDETAALRAELLRARAKAYELHRVYADLRDLRARYELVVERALILINRAA